MTLPRKTLLRLGLVAGLALVLSGCYRHYPGYSYAPRASYAAPYGYGHDYKPGYHGQDYRKSRHERYRYERSGHRRFGHGY